MEGIGISIEAIPAHYIGQDCYVIIKHKTTPEARDKARKIVEAVQAINRGEELMFKRKE